MQYVYCMDYSDTDIWAKVDFFAKVEPEIALQRIKTKFNQAGIEKMQSDWVKGKTELSDELCSLLGDLSPDWYSVVEYHELSKFSVMAMNRRDAEWLHMIADEMFNPYTVSKTPQWRAKLQAVVDGTAKSKLFTIS